MPSSLVHTILDMRDREPAALLDYFSERSPLAKRMGLFIRRRIRLICVAVCLSTAFMIATPFALIQYGKHKWNVALASSTRPIRGVVVRFDGFVYGGDHLISGWAVRYKLVWPGQTDGFDAYLVIFPRFLEIDAPIFHS